MQINISESQTVGEVDSTLFSTIQAGPVNCLITLKNVGSNIMNYRFQEYAASWSDMDEAGTVLNNTLGIDEVRQLVLSSSSSQVRLVGNASGGSLLEFDISRYYFRPDGGAIPVLNV